MSHPTRRSPSHALLSCALASSLLACSSEDPHGTPGPGPGIDVDGGTRDADVTSPVGPSRLIGLDANDQPHADASIEPPFGR